jgi:hypothetical protein
MSSSFSHRTNAGLGRLIDSRRLLTYLSIDAPQMTPCVVHCPFCQQPALHIYPDPTHGGDWHYCQRCRGAGDMLELAARKLGLNVIETWRLLESRQIVKSGRTVLQGELEAYQHHVLERRHLVQRFWTEASQHAPAGGADARLLRQRLDLIDSDYSTCWAERGGRFLGVATNQELAKLLHPFSRRYFLPDKLPDNHLWTEALAIPFYDLPGRIAAFLFTVREETPPQDLYYFDAICRHRQRSMSRPAGIAMLPVLFEPKAATDGVVVATDPLLAASLHIRHFKRRSDVLPLTAIWPAAKETNLLRLHSPSGDIVVWCRQLTADVVRHAICMRAKIAIGRHSNDFEFVQKYCTAEEWLRRAQKQARPWDAVLEDHLHKLSEIEIEAFLASLQVNDQFLREFIAGCTISGRDRLREIYANRLTFRSVNLRKRDIIETPEGWIDAKDHQTISEAVLRLDRVIRQPKKTNQDYYQGRIIYRGEELPFTERMSVIERNVSLWLKRQLVAAGMDLPVIHAGFRNELLNIALRFQQPEVVQGIDSYGWDPETRRFVFPAFFLTDRGEVRKHQLPNSRSIGTPAQNLQKPEPLDLDETTLLSDDSPTSRLLWAVTAGVAYNLLAPLYDYEQRGLGLGGKAGPTGLELAKALGCPELPVQIHSRRKYKLMAERRDLWPIVLPSCVTVSEGWTRWLHAKAHNSVCRLNWNAFRVCSTFGTWSLIEADQPQHLEEAHVAVAARILPRFLQWLLAQPHRRLPRPLLKSVTMQLATWFGTEQGKPQAVLTACRLIETHNYARAADRFLELVCRFFDEGLLRQYHPVRHRGNCRHGLLHCADGQLAIPKDKLHRLLHEDRLRSSLLIDTSRVSLVLAKAGKLLDEREVEGEPSWIISEAWWNERLESWRARQRQRYAKV